MNMQNPFSQLFKIGRNGSVNNNHATFESMNGESASEQNSPSVPDLTFKQVSLLQKVWDEYYQFKNQDFFAIGKEAGLMATSLNDKVQLIAQYEGKFKVLAKSLILKLQQENEDLENKKTKIDAASFELGNINTQLKKNKMEIEKLSEEITKDFRVDPTADLNPIFIELSRGYDFGRSNF